MSASRVTVSDSGEEWAAPRHDQVPGAVRFPGRIQGGGPLDSREQAHSSVSALPQFVSGTLHRTTTRTRMHKSAEMDALLQQFSEEAQQLKAPSAFRERFIANLVIAAVAGVAQVVVGLLNFDSFVSWLMWVLFVCGLVGAGGCAVAMVRERNRITRRCEDLASRIVELDRREH
ncbi:hypothetical protein KAREA_49810 (plasmid) [Prescottella equi]|nr:hypothetical protein KAREA_49810 [Prescottella equi]BDE61713.1 hypothetical protein REA19_47290 [Prescottella equi]